MSLTNKLQKTVDRPVWEWCRFNPIGNTAAASVLCTPDDGSGRYMYYLHGNTTTFYRYDTWTDGWQLLAPALLTSGTVSSALKYSVHGGYRGKVLALGTNTPATILIPGLDNNLLGKLTDNTSTKIRIMAGTGAGQERTITSAGQPNINFSGSATGGSTSTVVDSTALWKWNQWRGYQVRITYGTGLGQVRKILYNNATTLFTADYNLQEIDTWNTALFTVGAAAGSYYQIESSTITVNSNWDVIPDATSTFVCLTGGIWYITTAATPGWAHLSYYDIHSDVWIPKTVPMGNLTGALATDWSIERTGEIGGFYVGPVAATNGGSNTVRTFTDTAASWTLDQWAGYQVRITAGTCQGQRRRIAGNTTNTLFVQRPFDAVPGLTDTYGILGDTDKIYLSGNGAASMYQYSIENDLWSSGVPWDWGVARIGSIQLKKSTSIMGGQEAFGITSISSYLAAGITSISGMVAAGSGYTKASVGVYCTIAGGTGGICVITGVSDAGGVSSVELAHSGTATYTAGTQVISGGGGTLASVTLVVGKTGLVTTAKTHNLKTGDPVLIAGAETDTGWNGACTVLGVPSQTTLCVTPYSGATAGNPTFTAQSATLLRDTAQNWTAGEHIGKILMTYHTPTAAGVYTLQTISASRITSNTTNSLTVAALTNAPTNGLTRYVIFTPEALGREEVFKNVGQGSSGYATAGGATSLTDSTKAWQLNQWVGHKVRIVSGTGFANGEQAITASGATSLTVASWASATPDTTSKYQIMDSFGNTTDTFSITVIKDAAKNWPTNILVGKKVKIMSGVNCGAESALITANTANTFTITALGTMPTVDMTYSILSSPVRASSTTLQWAYNPSVMTKGRYMISARGNTPYFDIYDICKNTWEGNTLFTPQTDILVAGTMYAYDGADRLYFTIGATGKVQYLDLSTGMIMSSGQTPYAQGAALVGNRMEIVSTTDGLDYIYIMRHTGAEMWRTLAFWSGW